ncbi:TPA: DUF4354 family protein [Pseudomonas aeruginosa]
MPFPSSISHNFLALPFWFISLSLTFRLDTVDEELTAETLKPGATVEGEAIFASEDDAVYGASLVRLSDRCK